MNIQNSVASTEIATTRTNDTILNNQNIKTMETMTANSANTVLNGFNKGVIYSLSELTNAGVKIARLEVNRAIND